MRPSALLVPLLLLAAGTAAALDRPVSGAKLQLARSSSGREKLVVVSRDPALPFPAAGSADDPRTAGLRLEIAADGEGAVPVTLTVPPGAAWTTSGAADRWRWTNRAAPAGPSAVHAVQLRRARALEIDARDAGLALGAPLQRVVVRVTIGTLRSCAVFGGASVRRDVRGRFTAANAPAPAVPDCSDASLGLVGGSTTTTTLPERATVLDLVTGAAGGACGRTADGGGSTLETLTCGGLDIGGGNALVQTSLTPDGSTSRLRVNDCTGDVCAVGPWGASGPTHDCTDTGCLFGAPLPIPNGGTSTCVVNRFAGPVAGHIDLATGSTDDLAIPLASQLYLTGDETQPCPRCSATGTPSAPGTGTCDRGARAGQACSTTNGQGLSRDCPPGGADANDPCTPGSRCADGSQNLGTIPVGLAPLTTGTLARSAATGIFCPGQPSNHPGCFGTPACRAMELTGSPAGPLQADGDAGPVTVAALFCIPVTPSALVNFAADLPGPGASTITGTLVRRELVNTTTTTTQPAGSTTTTTTPTTTSTTGAPTTTTTTLLPPLLPFTVEMATTAGTGTCGSTRDGLGAVRTPLACGTLSLGDGAGAQPASVLPDGAVVHFDLGSCGPLPPTTCSLTATTAPGAGFDCSTTGCFFGPPVTVPNGSLSVCTVNTFRAPATGTVDLLSGATTADVALGLHLYLTGDAAQPCPRCSATGAPGAPGTGTCDRGANAGGACVSTNSQGLSHDCLPGGADGSVDLGVIAATLPVTTGTATQVDAGGLFCAGQANAGCFGDPACRTVTLTGAPPSFPLGASLSPQPTTLVSAFCVPASGSPIVDLSAGLPGPAAISLPAQVRTSL